MLRIFWVAGEIAAAARTIIVGGAKALAFVKDRAWLSLILDVTLKHMTGKTLTEHIIDGGDFLEAKLFALFGNKGPSIGDIKDVLLTAEAEDIMSRYSHTIDKERGMTEEQRLEEVLSAVIPSDTDLGQWAQSMGKKFGMSALNVLRRRVALLNYS